MAYERDYKGEVIRNTKSRFYAIWNGIKSRTMNPKEKSFADYGARGIKMDEKWLDFVGFYNDMYESYKASGLEKPTIERIDNNGDYTKENCKWISKAKQAGNKRNTKWITWKGQTKYLTEWGRELGVKRSTMMQRYFVYKWPIHKLLTPTK